MSPTLNQPLFNNTAYSTVSPNTIIASISGYMLCPFVIYNRIAMIKVIKVVVIIILLKFVKSATQKYKNMYVEFCTH